MVNPEIEQLVDAVVHAPPAGDDVAVYSLMGAPPSSVGALHERETDWFPAVPATPEGELGAAAPTVMLKLVLLKAFHVVPPSVDL